MSTIEPMATTLSDADVVEYFVRTVGVKLAEQLDCPAAARGLQGLRAYRVEEIDAWIADLNELYYEIDDSAEVVGGSQDANTMRMFILFLSDGGGSVARGVSAQSGLAAAGSVAVANGIRDGVTVFLREGAEPVDAYEIADLLDLVDDPSGEHDRLVAS